MLYDGLSKNFDLQAPNKLSAQTDKTNGEINGPATVYTIRLIGSNVEADKKGF